MRPTNSIARCFSSQRYSVYPAFIIAIVVVLGVRAESAMAQSVPYQRAFSQSKIVVEKRIKEMQGANSGRLPTVEGFVVSGDRPLDRFQRAYFECAEQVTSTSSGGSMVRVSATITAWYADPAAAKSGYQVLPSNGRLEADFLDRLQDALMAPVSSASTTGGTTTPPAASKNHSAAPALSAPSRGSSAPIGQSRTGSPFKLGDPLNLGAMPSLATQKAVVDRHTEEEAKEAKGLEEILRNQARPNNLVAVKIKDTAVLASPSEGAKVLFLAAAEDEFEILDENPNWVHIRISGLSRGWLRRSSVEMLNNEPDRQPAETQATEEPAPGATQPFHVDNEQVATFPGEWAPLHGKTVRIVSILKSSDNAATTGPVAKLSFAKSLLDREYAEFAKTSTTIAGVVMIFDSEDGGMVSATLAALRQWKSGSLSDEAFLRRCFFDPPEAFGLTANQ